MNTREIESLLKNVLKSYTEVYNNIQKEKGGNKTTIDFNVTFTDHLFDANTVPGYDPSKPEFKGVKDIHGKKLTYFRLSRLVFPKKGDPQKRVIFTTFRILKAFKNKNEMYRSMYIDCVRKMMTAGIEYSEALFLMNEQNIANSMATQNKGNLKKSPVAKKRKVRVKKVLAVSKSETATKKK